MNIIKNLFRKHEVKIFKKEFAEAYMVYVSMINQYLDKWNKEWKILYPEKNFTDPMYDEFMNRKFDTVAKLINLTSYSKKLMYYVENLEFKAIVIK